MKTKPNRTTITQNGFKHSVGCASIGCVYYDESVPSNCNSDHITIQNGVCIFYSAPVPCESWISVEDRLPENGQVVDIYNPHDGRIPFVEYEDGEWCSQYFKWTGVVTHWQPLPAPPKEE